MKSTLIIFFLSLAVIASAQDAKYLKAMEKQVGIADTASSFEVWQNVANSFERIGGANPKEWLPPYYQAFSNAMLSSRVDDNAKKDEYLDKADALVSKADSLLSQNAEIIVLKSLINSMRISIDPASRGMTYGMKAGMQISSALELDPENPRAYYLKGVNTMFTPEQWGGGKDKALPILHTAMEKYEKFKPASPIMPHWGEERCRAMLEECKKAEKK